MSRPALRNDDGMVVFITLTILSLLMAVGLGVLLSTQSDSKVTANLRSATETFYIAEAGIAWAKAQLAQTPSNPPALAETTQNFSTGSFTVSFLSSTRVAPATARVVVRSTGVNRNASQVIQAGLIKTYDIADAALGLRGNARAAFAGDGFLLSGFDHDATNGQRVFGASPRPGISAANASVLTELWERLDGAQKAAVIGGDQNGAPASVSEFLPPAALTSLIQQACASAGAVRLTMPADGALSFAGLTWGSSTSPQVRCIEGLASPGDSVVFSGNATGAGLLVVRNADLVLAGPLRWEGWIVVTGENVSLRVTGQDTKEVFGAVTLIEDSPTLPAERFTLNVQGWLNVFYSRGGLGKAVALIPAAALEDNYAFLPTVISQDHWHALTP